MQDNAYKGGKPASERTDRSRFAARKVRSRDRALGVDVEGIAIPEILGNSIRP